MKSVLVWDWPVRLSHWLIVFLFTGLIITGKSEGDYLEYHFYMGYSLSAVVIARLIYGIYGSRYARFSQFVYRPRVILAYFLTLISGKKEHYLGHNPIGGLMVVVLLLALCVQWGAGLYTSDDIFWFGPLNQYAEDDWNTLMSFIHHLLPNGLLFLVGAHILAVLYHEIGLKERLILPMLHGRKETCVKELTPVKTPQWGIIFSLLIGLAWLALLWKIPL